MGIRTPMLRILNQRKIVVVGLGCIGAASTVEFARSGVGELRILDDDVVEPATTPRWPLGLTAAGKQKANALRDFVQENYAYTTVKTLIGKFGGVTGLGGIDLKQADEFMRGVDLIYDATAESGIHYLLAETARQMGITYVCVSATPGCWGGRIVRIIPQRTEGCWACLLHAMESKEIPEPAEDPNGVIRPPGCADPSFVGAGFDILSVVVTGVRMSVMALSRGQAGGYPDLSWDIAILGLRDESGDPILPSWNGFQLRRHSECKNH